MRILTIFIALSSFLACKPRSQDGSSRSLAVPEQTANLDAFVCPKTEKVKVAFFDADSTLRVAKGASVTANGPKDVNLLPFVGSKIADLNAKGYLVAIVSNQLGIEKGKVSKDDAEAALILTAQMIAARGGQVDWVGYAPADDDNRKPKTGMARQLIAAVQSKCQKDVDLEASFMVGDSGYLRGKDGPHPDGRPADDFSNADRGFAAQLFAPETHQVDASHFQEPTDFFGWKTFHVYNVENSGELEDFLLTIEATAKAKAPGTDREALLAEVQALRQLNDMPQRSLRFVHFNIKELRTDKLVNAQDSQVQRAALNLRLLNPDLLSINEIQYDLPNVPTQGLPGTGANMQRLMERVQLDGATADWSFNLAPANTGKRAKKQADGNYTVNPNAPGAAQRTDEVSFGTFPGQYSTGFGSRFPIKKNMVFTATKWVEWDSEFHANDALKLPSGAPLPVDMELFDKNFNDSLVNLAGKDVHIITFHTVPAFGFGGSADTNIARNAAQLAFLEWYLLGTCDPGQAKSAVRRCETEVHPLAADSPFIAVGDFNVDWGTASGGAEVLKRLLTNPKINPFRAEHFDANFRQDDDQRSRISYLSDGVDLGKIQSELDYFLVSKHFKIDSGRVFAPLSSYKQYSCHPTKSQAEQAKAAVTLPDDQAVSVSTRYGDDGTRSYCVISVSKEFATFRQGSDHFPVYITFHWVD